jgi:hypothetical protein
MSSILTALMQQWYWCLVHPVYNRLYNMLLSNSLAVDKAWAASGYEQAPYMPGALPAAAKQGTHQWVLCISLYMVSAVSGWQASSPCMGGQNYYGKCQGKACMGLLLLLQSDVVQLPT